MEEKHERDIIYNLSTEYPLPEIGSMKRHFCDFKNHFRIEYVFMGIILRPKLKYNEYIILK